ncbi:uncharacterized protein LAESUDRAFT_714741 [Laetiporus sulphureus 93-53]|uniref:Uncharacterized protein n=1 Tax=Laetiporus sulphureus 93-53 TaxID=1314785 RepID=A0A165DWI8_9APHY|nr:uncharacterized protein LAESUDRAFT_714741 [Laetiporus sulphureus 93-53]KZT05776.1 hypothetical protein LAESUDRAFT_714741 [Laetiporus sulphureus 93-53]
MSISVIGAVGLQIVLEIAETQRCILARLLLSQPVKHCRSSRPYIDILWIKFQCNQLPLGDDMAVALDKNTTITLMLVKNRCSTCEDIDAVWEVTDAMAGASSIVDIIPIIIAYSPSEELILTDVDKNNFNSALDMFRTVHERHGTALVSIKLPVSGLQRIETLTGSDKGERDMLKVFNGYAVHVEEEQLGPE